MTIANLRHSPTPQTVAEFTDLVPACVREAVSSALAENREWERKTEPVVDPMQAAPAPTPAKKYVRRAYRGYWNGER